MVRYNKEKVHKLNDMIRIKLFNIEPKHLYRGGVPEWLYNGGDCEWPPQPFATGVGLEPCFNSFSTRCTYSPYRFMQVPRNGDRRPLPKSRVFAPFLPGGALK